MTTLRWNRGLARVTPIGAMLTDLEFDLGAHGKVRPLHKAPWLDETLPENTPPLLAHLQGEWPCVPFGAYSEQPLGRDWSHRNEQDDSWPHGYSANHAWQIMQESPDTVSASIDYPLTHPVRQLSRQLQGVANNAAIEIELEIHMRRNAALPIGLHPVFRLPQSSGQARMCLGQYERAYNYPADSGGTAMFSEQDSFRFDELSDSGFDPLALPYRNRSETLLLLTGVEGLFSLDNHAEGYRVTLEWDVQAFPSLMLWISNGGRSAAPWNSRHWALGVEPVCSAFDLGNAVSRSANPLSLAGVRCCQNLNADLPFHTRYQISAQPL